MAIIDHETMTKMGPTDETMPLRAVTPQGQPETFDRFRVSRPELERRMKGVGSFPVSPLSSVAERLSARKPRLDEAAPTKTSALLDESGGVEQESSDDTSTFALPAVWKMTGKPSAVPMAHRSAAHVQRVFNEAGWPIAVWFGEATRSYWVMDENGLHEFDSITTMYRGMGWETL